ncbi:hypothetical protein [Streptomyces mirabilis]|uniref:hypothetical protein n=1 Tax=Streptomyces mirabilis TaxID=68239 RepID=UPI0022505EFE|nr:hypothetical protein [Streptomyces mirabilis]MCX4429682.1 hypothetical protein [Streptomyces mirabilis]
MRQKDTPTVVHGTDRRPRRHPLDTRFADLDSRLADAVSSAPLHWPTPTCPTASARAPRSTSPPDPATFHGGYTDYRILPTTES